MSKWMRWAWTSPIPKYPFDGTTERCRGISVTPALARLLGKIVTARVTAYVEQMGCLCDAQDGFRRGRSTLRPVTRLQNFLARVDRTHILSVDIRRAFDMAEPRLATSYLSRIGIPDAVSSFFVSQLDGSQTYVWSAYGWTDRVQVRRGTRQGGVESPLLFLLLVDPILHILERELQYDFTTTPVPTPGDPEQVSKVEVSADSQYAQQSSPSRHSGNTSLAASQI
eukprot:gene13341-biopygen529